MVRKEDLRSIGSEGGFRYLKLGQKSLESREVLKCHKYGHYASHCLEKMKEKGK